MGEWGYKKPRRRSDKHIRTKNETMKVQPNVRKKKDPSVITMANENTGKKETILSEEKNSPRDITVSNKHT